MRYCNSYPSKVTRRGEGGNGNNEKMLQLATSSKVDRPEDPIKQVPHTFCFDSARIWHI